MNFSDLIILILSLEFDFEISIFVIMYYCHSVVFSILHKLPGPGDLENYLSPKGNVFRAAASLPNLLEGGLGGPAAFGDQGRGRGAELPNFLAILVDKCVLEMI